MYSIPVNGDIFIFSITQIYIIRTECYVLWDMQHAVVPNSFTSKWTEEHILFVYMFTVLSQHYYTLYIYSLYIVGIIYKFYLNICSYSFFGALAHTFCKVLCPIFFVQWNSFIYLTWKDVCADSLEYVLIPFNYVPCISYFIESRVKAYFIATFLYLEVKCLNFKLILIYFLSVNLLWMLFHKYNNVWQ